MRATTATACECRYAAQPHADLPTLLSSLLRVACRSNPVRLQTSGGREEEVALKQRSLTAMMPAGFSAPSGTSSKLDVGGFTEQLGELRDAAPMLGSMPTEQLAVRS